MRSSSPNQGSVTLSIDIASDGWNADQAALNHAGAGDCLPRQRYRHRHSRRQAPHHLRGISAGRRHHQPQVRRHRAGAFDQPRNRASPRRRDQADQRAWRGQHVRRCSCRRRISRATSKPRMCRQLCGPRVVRPSPPRSPWTSRCSRRPPFRTTAIGSPPAIGSCSSSRTTCRSRRFSPTWRTKRDSRSSPRREATSGWRWPSDTSPMRSRSISIFRSWTGGPSSIGSSTIRRRAISRSTSFR